MATLRYLRRCQQPLTRLVIPSRCMKTEQQTQEKDVIKTENTSILQKVVKLIRLTPPKIDLKSTKGISVKHARKETANSAMIRYCLEKDPSREGMINAVDMYIKKNRIRRGHIDFITTAMKFMEPYGLEKDLEVYNKLFDVFPRDRFTNKSLFDTVWPKAHPQMFLALDILTKMEWQGVIPDERTHEILYEVFGPSSMPVQKIYRFWFWFEELKDLNPYKLPEEIYKDRVNLIKAAVDRILGNNDGTEIVEISTPIEDDGGKDYDHFVISSQTCLQQKYVTLCSIDKPLYIEGPIHLWMNHKKEEFFILKTGKGDLLSTDDAEVDQDEEREGVILGVCFATKPYEETLQRWLTHLQKSNPTLKDFKIIFDITEEKDSNEQSQEAIASS